MKNNTSYIAKIGALSAAAFMLQVMGSIMQIKVAGFLEIEISDLPAVIAAFALGPVAGVAVEFIKNLIHCMMTSTGFVGEFANFAVNSSFMIVCGLIYSKKKTKKNAVIALLAASFVMTIMSFFINLYIMLPMYMQNAEYGVKLSLAATTIVPFNFIRGIVLSFISMIVYKKISRLIK